MVARARRQLSAQVKDAAEEAIRNLELSVRFIVTDFTVEFVADKVRSQEYYVPEYQREMVWDDTVQSRFIESVLIGLPIRQRRRHAASGGRSRSGVRGYQGISLVAGCAVSAVLDLFPQCEAGRRGAPNYLETHPELTATAELHTLQTDGASPHPSSRPLIVETHSEMILLRARRWVAEGRLPAEHVLGQLGSRGAGTRIPAAENPNTR